MLICMRIFRLFELLNSSHDLDFVLDEHASSIFLHCFSCKLNANCNAFSHSLNARQINDVGFCRFTNISHFDCTRSSLRYIVVTATLIQPVPRRILQKVNFDRRLETPLRTDCTICSHCSFVTKLFMSMSMTLPGTRPWNSELFCLSLVATLPQQVASLRKSLHCVAFQLRITGT